VNIVFAGAFRIGEVQSGVYLYDHLDRLGSVRLVTNNVVTQTFATQYKPFGTTYATSGSELFSFTGKQLQPSLNLYYFGYRYLDPTLGRFVQMDPLMNQNPSDPQAANRYSYARNNPLRFLDPDGRSLQSTKPKAPSVQAHVYQGHLWIAIPGIGWTPAGSLAATQSGYGIGSGVSYVNAKGVPLVFAHQVTPPNTGSSSSTSGTTTTQNMNTWHQKYGNVVPGSGTTPTTVTGTTTTCQNTFLNQNANFYYGLAAGFGFASAVAFGVAFYTSPAAATGVGAILPEQLLL
jgi:RHS repeat-associated protein